MDAKGYQRTSCWRWRLGGTKGQVAGGGGSDTKGQVAGGGVYGVPKDKLLDVETRGTKGPYHQRIPTPTPHAWVLEKVFFSFVLVVLRFLM